MTKSLYCHKCKKHFNVRKVDIELIKANDPTFNGSEYTKGCFFKALTKLNQNYAIENANYHSS